MQRDELALRVCAKGGIMATSHPGLFERATLDVLGPHETLRIAAGNHERRQGHLAEQRW